MPCCPISNNHTPEGVGGGKQGKQELEVCTDGGEGMKGKGGGWGMS